jgi:hypothetical protein
MAATADGGDNVDAEGGPTPPGFSDQRKPCTPFLWADATKLVSIRRHWIDHRLAAGHKCHIPHNNVEV